MKESKRENDENVCTNIGFLVSSIQLRLFSLLSIHVYKWLDLLYFTPFRRIKNQHINSCI